MRGTYNVSIRLKERGKVRILVLIIGNLPDQVGVIESVVFDELHLELTLRQRISIEMSNEMRHIIVKLHHVFRDCRRRSSGCVWRFTTRSLCTLFVGRVVWTIFGDIISRSDSENSHKLDLIEFV